MGVTPTPGVVARGEKNRAEPESCGVVYAGLSRSKTGGTGDGMLRLSTGRPNTRFGLFLRVAHPFGGWNPDRDGGRVTLWLSRADIG
jgi:hypothetical protein